MRIVGEDESAEMPEVWEPNLETCSKEGFD